MLKVGSCILTYSDSYQSIEIFIWLCKKKCSKVHFLRNGGDHSLRNLRLQRLCGGYSVIQPLFNVRISSLFIVFGDDFMHAPLTELLTSFILVTMCLARYYIITMHPARLHNQVSCSFIRITDWYRFKLGNVLRWRRLAPSFAPTFANGFRSDIPWDVAHLSIRFEC